MRSGRWGWLGYLSAAGFVTATVTYGLTVLGLAGPDEPDEAGDLTTRLAAHFAYQRDGFVFEQVANWAFVGALLSLGMLAVVLHAAGWYQDQLTSRLCATVLLAGSLIAAASQVVYLSAMERLLYSSRFAEVDVVSLTVVADAVNRVDDYLDGLGYVLIGLGLVLLARLESRAATAPPAWRALTVALAVGVFAAAGTSFAASDAHDWVLLVVGLLLAPAWTAWLGVLLGRGRSAVNASGQMVE